MTVSAWTNKWLESLSYRKIKQLNSHAIQRMYFDKDKPTGYELTRSKRVIAEWERRKAKP